MVSLTPQSEGWLRLKPAGGQDPRPFAPGPAGDQTPLQAACSPQASPHPFLLLAPCPSPQRKRTCLACIKLDHEFQVLGRMVHCPMEMQVQRVRVGRGQSGEAGKWPVG